MPDSRDEQLQRRIGRRLRELRMQRGLTQRDVADALRKTGHQYYQDIERGLQNVTVGTLSAIATVLNVDIVEIFEPPVSSEAPKAGRPPKMAFGKLPAKARRRRP